MDKYLYIAIGVLLLVVFVLFTLYRSTLNELSEAKNQNKLLTTEIQRRDENAKNLSKRLQELNSVLDRNTSWANGLVPSGVLEKLRK